MQSKDLFFSYGFSMRSSPGNYYVYILMNMSGDFYIGVTNDLQKRLYEHRNQTAAKFTSKYNITRLVYFEWSSDINAAIAREKQLKGWRRSKKIALIQTLNPHMYDLSLEWTTV